MDGACGYTQARYLTYTGTAPVRDPYLGAPPPAVIFTNYTKLTGKGIMQPCSQTRAHTHATPYWLSIERFYGSVSVCVHILAAV